MHKDLSDGRNGNNDLVPHLEPMNETDGDTCTSWLIRFAVDVNGRGRI